MGRPVHADGRQTRQAILDAALELFADKGYFGTSMRDIARAVGVRESAFYNYFAGKEAIFNALIAADHESKAEQVAGLLETPIGDVGFVLERLATLALDNFCAPRQQKLFRVLMSDGMRLAKEGRINLLERMTSGTSRLHDLMRRLIDAGGLRPGDPEFLVMEFMGPLLLWRHRHALSPAGRLMTNRKAFVRDHVDHFLRSATVRPSEARLARGSQAHTAKVPPASRPRRRGSRARAAS